METSGGVAFGAVSAGACHNCALTASSGTNPSSFVYCWGDNASGQLGNGNLGTDEAAPVNISLLSESMSPVFFAAVDVAAGEAHTCAGRTPFSDHPLVCWGDNTSGQLGHGTAGGTVDQAMLSPVTLPPEIADIVTVDNWTGLTAGVDHTCAVLQGTAILPMCWGENASGQLAVGDTQDRSSPAVVVR